MTGSIATDEAVADNCVALVMAIDGSAVATVSHGRIISKYAICDCRAALIAVYSAAIADNGKSIRADDAIRDYWVTVVATEDSAAVVLHRVICDDTVFYGWAASVAVNCAPNAAAPAGNGKAVNNRICIFAAVVKVEPSMRFLCAAVAIDYCRGNNIRVARVNTL